MQAEEYTMSSRSPESPELDTFLADCKVLFHTVYGKNVKEGHFTVADLKSTEFNIHDKVRIHDDEVTTHNAAQTESNLSKLRWFHIPANNREWVDMFMEKWFERAGGLDKKNWEQMWGLKVRPGPRHRENKPPHSRHMEPSCTMSKELDLASRQPGNIEAHELYDDYYSAQLPNKYFENSDELKQPLLALYAAEQVQSFENFNMGTDHQPTATAHEKDLQLVLQVADIIDELKIIRHLADKQREVLKALILALRRCHSSEKSPANHSRADMSTNFHDCSINGTVHVTYHSVERSLEESVETTRKLAEKLEGATRDTVVSADETLLLLIVELEELTQEGEKTHKMLLSLLDLTQTTAALMEARSTTQQGRVVMLFTIITIIFLPLSFFTSYFGQNVSQLTGDTSNPTSWELWRVGTPISIVVIVSALLIAYRIGNPSSRLWFWQRSTTDSSA
ncbi:hypothetical protein MKX08_008158 [Trichoderma sp. CBMAI-0020]|nr:hypothetical protein MKX08_008158 [Trichoderma sp. CBMAI-0020]